MRLRIVAVNDVYSLENLPRLRTLVSHHATNDPPDAFLVTLAGDFLAPSILSSLDLGRGMVDCLNQIPIDYAILGNHEDDLEIDQLRARLHELHATVLMTNVRWLDDSFPTSHVMTIGTTRVGIVGVVDSDPTLYRRPPFDGARVEPANAAARREADVLLANGCAWVIAMTHQTIADDRLLAESAPKFPLILGGHEHDSHLEQVGSSGGTWIVKAPSEATQAVIAELEWTAASPTPIVKVRLESVSGYAENAALRARVDAHMLRVHELEGATLLLLAPSETLSSIGTRVQQTSLGTLICSRLRDAFGAEGCLFNGGGIRGAREYRGRLTFGDVKTEVPFDNEVVVARLPGHVVRDAVAASRANAPAESGGFLQIDDRMTVDDHGRVTAIDGAPIDLDRVYRIALIRNLFDGLDRNEPLMHHANEHPAEIPMKTSGRDVKVVLIGAFAALLWKELGGFDAVDANHDGTVTKGEIADALERVGGQPRSELAAGVVLDALDQDHDHSLSREESEKK